MTITIGGINTVDTSAAELNAPPLPARPERDALEGLLTATLFPAAEPYRARIVDMLRVINDTQIGRELLFDFRTLATRGQYPAIELAPARDQGANEAAHPHVLFLSESALTAGASTIGVPPEIEHAPGMVLRLTQIRNALATRSKEERSGGAYAEIVDVPMDPITTVVAFRKELVRCGVPPPDPGASDGMGGPPRVTGDSGQANTRGMGPSQANADAMQPPDASVSSPYQTVIDHACVPRDTGIAGGVRRAFSWAQPKAQAFKNFLLCRQGASSIGSPGSRPASPSSAESIGEGGSIADRSPTPDRSPTADGSPTVDRPLIRATQQASGSRHKRNRSIRHRNEVDGAHQPSALQPADSKPIRP